MNEYNFNLFKAQYNDEGQISSIFLYNDGCSCSCIYEEGVEALNEDGLSVVNPVLKVWDADGDGVLDTELPPCQSFTEAGPITDQGRQASQDLENITRGLNRRFRRDTRRAVNEYPGSSTRDDWMVYSSSPRAYIAYEMGDGYSHNQPIRMYGYYTALEQERADPNYDNKNKWFVRDIDRDNKPDFIEEVIIPNISGFKEAALLKVPVHLYPSVYREFEETVGRRMEYDEGSEGKE